MASNIKCSDCGAALDESYGVEPRKPCPVCGSTIRQFTVKLETAHLTLKGSDVTLTVVKNVASLLMQAVIVSGAKTNEGQLIEAVHYLGLKLSSQ